MLTVYYNITIYYRYQYLYKIKSALLIIDYLFLNIGNVGTLLYNII